MNPPEHKYGLLIRRGGELSLSGKALAELMLSVLGRGVPFRFRIKGISMFPFIKEGDLVTVHGLKKSPLRRGDVIAFLGVRDNKVAVHRIVGKKRGCWVTKGDNNPEADGLIQKDAVLGCVRKTERRGRRVFLGLGPEKFIIAFLSRTNFFCGFVYPVISLLVKVVRKPVS